MQKQLSPCHTCNTTCLTTAICDQCEKPTCTHCLRPIYDGKPPETSVPEIYVMAYMCDDCCSPAGVGR